LGRRIDDFKEFIMKSTGIGRVTLVIAWFLGAWCFNVGAAQKEGVQASSKLDGKWYVFRQEQFGGAVPAAVAKRLSVVIDGNKMEWYIGNPAPNMAATITVDPDKKTTDAKVTRGSLNGKTMLGIYKLEDGRLHVCWAEVDAKRPEKFASTKRGGGAFEYTIYSRTQDKDEKKQPAKEAAGAGKKDIRALEVKLADKWKDDGAAFGVRRFKKDKIELLAVLHPGKAPATPLEFVEMSKKDANLFPVYAWVKTTGIGKFDGGVFIVGDCKAGANAMGIGVARSVDGVTVLFIGAPADDAATRKEMLEMVKSARFGPDVASTKPANGKPPKLADLKLTLPKGWESKYSDIVMWRISHGGFSPSIEAMWMVSSRYPKDVDAFVTKLQDTDYFGNGLYLNSVTEKGKLADGLFVLGKFKLKTEKEAKYVGFAIIRDFGGEKLIFESFSTYYDDARLLREAMEICKSAKF
jgi:uncharacterized protein (TIGR03067 family)